MIRHADPTRLAPVAVYTYTRHAHLVRTLEALRRNPLASSTVLYVVSDGAKVPEHEPAVRAIRDHVDGLTGFREIVRVYRDRNFGLKESPPQAEKAILSDHGCIIDMEDDNIASTNYLDFLNAGLQHFEADERTYAISGYCPPVTLPPAGDFWRFPWNLSWGYAIWKRKHDRFHPLVNRYPDWKRSGLLQRQNRAGGLYVSDSVRRDYLGQKYFPDAILCTQMFEAGMQAVVPTLSKVRNIGQDGSGQSSHQQTDKFDVELDTSEVRGFDFDHESPVAARNRDDVVALFNGGPLTQWARRSGLYHRLSSLRQQWSTR